MPPKGKGKTKAPKKEEELKEEEVTEYDAMNLEMLREVIPMLRQQLEKAQIDRNYVQLERDTVNQFYEITKHEVSEFEMAISAKDREMELMEENHRVEVRVYMQKVKHLEYEHKHSIKGVTNEGRQLLHDEHESHEEKERALKTEKLSLKSENKERELVSMDEIMQLRHQNEKNLQKMREGFEANLDDLRNRCADRLKQLEDDLELRRKVDIHEVEERKNQHINDLMKNHDKAFNQMKSYYNDITNDNLKLIKTLKDDVAAMKRKAIENQKLMYDISQENKRLSEPLAIKVAEVAELQATLRDREKDRMSIRNAKARLVVLEEQFTELQDQQARMEDEFLRVEKERDDLYETFEASVRAVQEQSDFRNVMLEQKIQGMEQNIDRAEMQANEVMGSANLDPREVERMTQALDDVLLDRNKMARELQYMVTRAGKAYNDTLRTYTAKLEELGIPPEETREMGFEPLPMTTSQIPAGLVAK